MSLPFFYLPGLDPTTPELVLNEAGSRHCVQVLRMRTGEELVVTDGRGVRVRATLTRPDRRAAVVGVQGVDVVPFQGPVVTVGISPVKHGGRFEWFLEKVTELGVRRVIPLLCQHTEKQQVRRERLELILIAAMLQSEQVWLAELTEPQPLETVLAHASGPGSERGPQDLPARFIAHCREGRKEPLSGGHAEAIILIGPEGDFSAEEITLAQAGGWKPVSLGGNRLRTETAGVAAAAITRLT